MVLYFLSFERIKWLIQIVAVKLYEYNDTVNVLKLIWLVRS